VYHQLSVHTLLTKTVPGRRLQTPDGWHEDVEVEDLSARSVVVKLPDREGADGDLTEKVSTVI
jgi:hypothetical protein